MQKRRLGNTDVELSVIGLGTWAIGGGGWKFGWGPQDDTVSVAAIRRALELGVNWIDTAPLYGLGHAETITGRALKGMGTKPFIATKCGLTWDARRKAAHCLKKENIRKEVEESLRRLKVDRIDLYQLHWPSPDEDLEEAWEEMAALAEEGKIRYAGVCNCSTQQLERLLPILRPVSLQAPYSLLEHGLENELFPFCVQHRISVLGYSPLFKGFLAGSITAERLAGMPMDDHRQRMEEFRQPVLGINLEFVEKLKTLAHQSGRTPAQLAIAWALRKETVTGVIVGARTPAQIEENAQAADRPLTQDELKCIVTLIDERHNRQLS